MTVWLKLGTMNTQWDEYVRDRKEQPYDEN